MFNKSYAIGLLGVIWLPPNPEVPRGMSLFAYPKGVVGRMKKTSAIRPTPVAQPPPVVDPGSGDNPRVWAENL